MGRLGKAAAILIGILALAVFGLWATSPDPKFNPASFEQEPLKMTVAPFEEAVVSMEVGGLSAPVQTQFGWHVIKLNETRIKDAPSLDQVRAEVTEDVRMGAIEARVTELSDAATVERKTVEEIDPTLLDDLSLLDN